MLLDERVAIRRDRLSRSLSARESRDASGQPLAEYVDSPGSAHPRHAKDFVHGAGMLLMERWIDGSAPSATNTSPMAANGNVGLSVSAADPIETWAVDIRPEGGGASLVSGLEVDAAGKIWLPESNLTPDVTNYLRIRRDDGEAGAYSNAVTVAYDPDVNAQSANQVRAVSVSRSGTNVQVRWQLFQANGKALRLYYQRADGGGTLLLTPAGLASGTTTFSIQNQSLTVQCGYFYLTQQISGSSWSGPSPAAGLPPSGSSTEFGAGQNCDPPSTPPSAPVWVNTFHHRDHLGSLRIVTDAGGWMVGEGHDYYPFGMEMVPAGTSTEGGSRKRFTGHERDEASRLDYMLGRYAGPQLTSFLSVDPARASVRRSLPQTWNRYSYAWHDPIRLIDPDGRVVEVPSNLRSTVVDAWAKSPKFRTLLREAHARPEVVRLELVGRITNPRADGEVIDIKFKPELIGRPDGTMRQPVESAVMQLGKGLGDQRTAELIAHGLVHFLKGALDGVEAAKDQGPAEEAETDVQQEYEDPNDDKSRKQAKKEVEALITPDPNFPTAGPNSKAAATPCQVNPVPGSGETTCRTGDK